MDRLDQVVIKLHECAREVEREFSGPGVISEDIRGCADRLSKLINARLEDAKK